MQRTSINVIPFSFLLATLVFLLSGCLVKLPGYGQGVPATTAKGQPDLRSVETVKSILYAQLEDWRGVRYRPGGMSKSGIDCSGFVYLTFQSRFGMALPRTTRHQAKSGKNISLNRLRSGDLVFFKTGWVDRHVGIYVEDRRFVHVSTKNGVMLSNLEDPYWKKRYWKAVRISP